MYCSHTFSFEKNEIHVHTVNVYFVCDIPGNSGLFFVASSRRHRWLTSIPLLDIIDTVECYYYDQIRFLVMHDFASRSSHCCMRVGPYDSHWLGGIVSAMMTLYGIIYYFWNIKLGGTTINRSACVQLV